jgi:uncharacterized protein YndB with AHSA1/START domain
MATPDARPDTTLRIERTIAAPREKVFEAWTRAEAMTRWFAPGTHTCRVHALEARAGGAYRVEMRDPEGKSSFVAGVYREITAPSRLVFTWAWEQSPDRGETLVTVELHDEGGGTRLVLTHERFPNTEVRDRHDMGWTGCLANLVEMFAA